MAKLARTSISAVYECCHDWPDDCFVQCGASGVVLTGAGSYRTAFFEAFPQEPETFLRGEGETIEAAEEECWQQYQTILACPGHEFERRGYRNGLGFCKHCDLAQRVFEPLEAGT